MFVKWLMPWGVVSVEQVLHNAISSQASLHPLYLLTVHNGIKENHNKTAVTR